MNDLKDILVNIGAIAGFAGIVGLAVLAMLYFSQARDVRRLREWAGREPERAAEVELRAQQIASQAIAQAYESMAMRQSEADAAAGIAHEQGVEVDASVVVAEGAAVEVGGTEEAELVAAEPGTDDYMPLAEQPGSTPAQQETQAFDVLAADAAAEPEVSRSVDDAEADEASADEAGATEEAAQPEPIEAAASSNGQAGSDTVVHPPPAESVAAESAEQPAAAGEGPPSRLAPSTPAAARAGSPLPPLPPLDTSEFRAVNRPPTPPIPDYYLSTEQTGSGHFEAIEADDNRRSRVPFAVAGVLVAIFAVVLIATQIGGSDTADTMTKDKAAQRAARDKKTASTSPRNPQINRPAVNVSVLNGTDTSGLAKVVGDRLVQAGFTSTTTGNRNDGNHATSTVYYSAGSKLEAEEVAKELRIEDVKEADEETLAAGGSVPVIVVLGADIDQ